MIQNAEILNKVLGQIQKAGLWLMLNNIKAVWCRDIFPQI